jgi:hypothetical protein
MLRVRLAAIALLLAVYAAPAEGHDWFTGTTDPVTGHACCTGPGLSFAHVDCMAVPADLLTAGVIEETAQGYRVRLTLDQAKRFNDQTTRPIDEVVPWSRVQPGLSQGVAICIWQNAVNCFFTASNT